MAKQISMLRVIAGKFKGRKLLKPDSKDIRPTRDIVKEALFNILGPGIAGMSFLDLYAGTGSVGIEACSRGASEVVFCELKEDAIGVLEKNLANLDIADSCRVVKGDVMSVLSARYALNRSFDIVFMDPPYRDDLAKKTLNAICVYDIIAPQGLALCEHYAEEDLPEVIGCLSLLEKRRYGNSAISFYRKVSAASEKVEADEKGSGLSRDI